MDMGKCDKFFFQSRLIGFIVTFSLEDVTGYESIWFYFHIYSGSVLIHSSARNCVDNKHPTE